MEFYISSNRAASYLSMALKITYTKGTLISCNDAIKILIADIDRETKKVVFNEVIDMCNSKEFYDFFKDNPESNELRYLMDEVLFEMKNGETERKEKEFEQLFKKIEHRKMVIGDIR